jgi:hypothetical protein
VETRLKLLYIKEKKDYLLSVKRLKLKREGHIEQSDKDYACVHTFLTGNGNTKNRKVEERNLFARVAFIFFFFSHHLGVYMCLCLNKKNASEVEREEKKWGKKKDVNLIILLFIYLHRMRMHPQHQTTIQSLMVKSIWLSSQNLQKYVINEFIVYVI